jgi:hypothetical protein
MTANDIGPDNWMIDFLPEALSPQKKKKKKKKKKSSGE